MTDRQRKARLRLQQLESERHVELRRLCQNLKEEMERLKSRYAANPEKFMDAVNDLMRHHDESIEAKLKAIQEIAAAELGELPFRTARSGVNYDVMPHRRRPSSRRKPRRRPDAGGVLVEPNRPKDLSGGAAAPLDFEE